MLDMWGRELMGVPHRPPNKAEKLLISQQIPSSSTAGDNTNLGCRTQKKSRHWTRSVFTLAGCPSWYQRVLGRQLWETIMSNLSQVWVDLAGMIPCVNKMCLLVYWWHDCYRCNQLFSVWIWRPAPQEGPHAWWCGTGKKYMAGEIMSPGLLKCYLSWHGVVIVLVNS